MSILENPTQLTDAFYKQICTRVSTSYANEEEQGNSGSYLVRDEEGNFLAIVKPASEEPLAPRNKRLKQKIKRWFAQRFRFTALQIQSGQGVYAEAAAYTIGAWLRDTLNPELPDIVPYTVMIDRFPVPNPQDKENPSFERVSLQCGANLSMKGPNLDSNQSFQPVIAAEKLLHTTNHYEKKGYPPLLKRLWSAIRKRVGLHALKDKGTPWQDAAGNYLTDEQFQRGQTMLQKTLKDQFALMSLHNYLINDVDKHGQNWLIVGDYKGFIQAISENNDIEAQRIANTLKISSIDNGAAFAPTQQRRWDWFQVRNRLQYYRLEMAKLAELPPDLIEKLWQDRSTFAQHIWDQYQHSESDKMIRQRVYAALERLAAVYEFSKKEPGKKTRCVADMCHNIKYRAQIKHYAKAHKDEIDSTVRNLKRDTISVTSDHFIDYMREALQQTGKPITFRYSTGRDQEVEDLDLDAENTSRPDTPDVLESHRSIHIAAMANA